MRTLFKVLGLAALLAPAGLPAAESGLPVPEGEKLEELRERPMPPVPGRIGEILGRYYNEGMGGIEAWSALESLRIDGVLAAGESEVQLRALKKKPDYLKLTIFNARREPAYLMGHDGDRSWTLPPAGSEQPGPRAMAGEEARRFAHNARFGTYLLYPYEAGKTIEYVDTEPVDGRVCHHIRVRLKSGFEIDYYIDIRNYLEVRVVNTDLETGSTETVAFDDYVRIEGVPVAKRIIQYEDDKKVSEFRVERIVANVGMTPWMFKMPAPPEQSSGGSAARGDG